MVHSPSQMGNSFGDPPGGVSMWLLLAGLSACLKAGSIELSLGRKLAASNDGETDSSGQSILKELAREAQGVSPRDLSRSTSMVVASTFGSVTFGRTVLIFEVVAGFISTSVVLNPNWLWIPIFV